MLHKKIHAHAKKHAKRAHAHVQDHGHKWLWFLSAVFAIILIYPYFSSANESIPEICDNWAINFDMCNTCEEWYRFDDENNKCIEEEEENNQNWTTICEEEDAINFNEEGECMYNQPEDQIILTGMIVYDPTNQTTENVTATITGFSTTWVTITNNNGENTYTFIENGSFTFEFQNADWVTGYQVATVDWIEEQIVSAQTCEIDITVPAGDDMIWSVLDVQRSANITCDTDQEIIIQLREHNQQRVILGTGVLEEEQAILSTTGLVNTGLYTITGIYLSGTIRESFDNNGVLVESGIYTEDTEYIAHTGLYIGQYTDFATWYQLRIIDNNQELLAESELFTIKNKAPIVLDVDIVFSGSVEIDEIVTLGKNSSIYTNIIIDEPINTEKVWVSINGTYISIAAENIQEEILENEEWNQLYAYEWTTELSTVTQDWEVLVIIHVEDMIENKNNHEIQTDIAIDTKKPSINNDFSIESIANGIQFTWTTDPETIYTFHYRQDEDDGEVFSTTGLSTQHIHVVTGITQEEYNFILEIRSIVGNTKTLEWNFQIDEDGSVYATFTIQDDTNIIELSDVLAAELYINILDQAVQQFQLCRENIPTNELEITIGNQNITLHVPQIPNNNILGAFMAFMISKLGSIETLSADQAQQVESLTNNFLSVLYLAETPDTCQHSLSNYYIRAFESIVIQAFNL